MKIVIFGANGKTGIHLVNQALKGGHYVRAFVHGSYDQLPKNKNLEIFEGDATDANAVNLALADMEAVISVLGHGRNTPPHMQTMSMENIIASAQAHNIMRIISLTGSGVRTSGDRPGIVDRFLNFMLKIILKDRIQDGIEHAQVLKKSDREWIIVRATKLTDGKLTKDYQIGPVRKGVSYPIARADVADFMLTQLSDDTYLHQMPYISH